MRPRYSTVKISSLGTYRAPIGRSAREPRNSQCEYDRKDIYLTVAERTQPTETIIFRGGKQFIVGKKGKLTAI